MKKFLSLVLALVMVMSLTVVGAGAKDFTDSDSITYDEAIDVISALGVVDGYSGGDFKPEAQLTRGAASKIICNLILGVAAASNLQATSAPFPDVPANSTFAGYIAYCANEGIIGGYGDGSFRPSNPLTGYAFMKMLLGALGYDSANEGLSGSNWSIQVAKLVQGIGLDNDLEEDFVGSKIVTREEACLYAFNTLKSNMVEYKVPGTTITVNGLEINQKASEATPRTYPVTVGGTTTEKNFGANGRGSIYDDGYIQFGEEHFARLVLNSAERDSFQRPEHMWTYKGDKIGSYTDTPDVSYEGKVTMADIYDDLNLTSTTKKFDVYIDGMEAGCFYPLGKNDYRDDGPAWFSDLDDNKTLKIDSGVVASNKMIGTGPGCVVECYKTGTQKAEGTIVVINTYIGEIVSVNAAEGKHAATAEIAPVGDYFDDATTNAAVTTRVLEGGDSDYEAVFETEKFEVGDVVTFNYAFSEDGTSGSPKKVAKAESVEGEVKDYTDQESFTLGGTEYKYSKMATQKVISSDIGTTVTAYLDKQGNVLYYTEGKDNAKNYALVLDAGMRGRVGGNSFEAELLFADGTTKLVTTDKQYGATDDASHNTSDKTCMIGEWVFYREDSRGRYVLTRPSKNADGTWDNMMDANHEPETTKYVVTSADNIGKAGDTASRLKIDGNIARLNSDTVIIIKTAADRFKVYTGVKNLPTIRHEDSAGNPVTNEILFSVLTRQNQTYAKFVYIDATDADVENRTNTDIFLVGAKAKLSNNGTDDYYSFKGVVDGKIVNRINLNWNDVDTQSVINHLISNDKSGILLSSFSVNDNLYEVDMDDEVNINPDGNGVSATTGEVEKVTAEAITIKGGSVTDSYAIADGCKFFRVDDSSTNTRIVESTWRGISKGGIGTNPRDKYAYVGLSLNRDYEVTAVYWRLA